MFIIKYFHRQSKQVPTGSAQRTPEKKLKYFLPIVDLSLLVDRLPEAKIKYSVPVVDLSLSIDRLSKAKIKYSLPVVDLALPVDRLKNKTFPDLRLIVFS